MIEKGSFWDIESAREYKSDYGEYNVLSREAEVDQIVASIDASGMPSYDLFKDGKQVATVKNTDLEVKRGIESVFYRQHTKPGYSRTIAKQKTIVNLDKAIICRVINPTHGRIATSSGDTRLICGNENDVFMQKHDWESEKQRGWY